MPALKEFAEQYYYKIEIPSEQNYYPDATFTDFTGCRFAVDIKTTYRLRHNPNTVSSMTLGTFVGYFRERDSSKNILYPYREYSAHFILGVIYTRTEGLPQATPPRPLKEADLVPRVIRDLRVFVEHKYKIASDRPGSGNTKNIGSVRRLDQILNGSGPFAAYGEQVFDDYWMHYQTRDMAGSGTPPYTNLEEYFKWRNWSR